MDDKTPRVEKQVPSWLKDYIDCRILELLAQDKEPLYDIWRKMRVSAATMLSAMNALSPEQRAPNFVAEVPCPVCGKTIKAYHDKDDFLVMECSCGYKKRIY